MAISNHERVSKVMEHLSKGLAPYVEREMKAVHKDRWLEVVEGAGAGPQVRVKTVAAGAPTDVQKLLRVMRDQWNDVFGRTLGKVERNCVHELYEWRNRWAHQEALTGDDAYRVLDSAHRLLVAIAAPEAVEVERQRAELLRLRFDEQARNVTRRTTVVAVEGSPQAGLLPWRQVAEPHDDVASGRYQQAEFAADLAQVYRNEGTDEYRVPREFFGRTFPTEGLKQLLAGALRRLSGKGGDPVVELQTNFGGGKTHSMLALYHLFSGAKVSELPGIEPVLKGVGLDMPPSAKRAVLVGTAIAPGQASKKADGTVVRTLWGELAWQLGGKDGFKLVADADATSTSPGEALDVLFKKHAPCLILIDEWVAYARQLFGKEDLPAGTFDTHFTFAQALTEAARRNPRVQVVLSIPASDERTDTKGNRVLVSDIEIGGEGGRAALERLKNVIGRTQSPWRPASAEESFEIVRRRLFKPIATNELFKSRDVVIRSFLDMYRQQAAEFPSDIQEGDYRARLEAAYPIHPELFERLYQDWGSLERFQRTRGVLRLMAAVIHELWERNDGGLMILPSMVPIDASAVQDELTRYLEDNWRPVIERDVDGPQSASLNLDRENPNLGRYSACRRVARTIYMGSAPNLRSSTRGIDDRRIRLGCVQPGEASAVFGDALRRLGDRANHLYVDGARYWFSPQPSVTRTADERAKQLSDDDVHEQIVSRLRIEARQRGDFESVRAAVASADVLDERDLQLVILGPVHPHTGKNTDSLARREAALILDSRGPAPRRYRNAVVFLAPDAARLRELEQAVRQYLAWKSIYDEWEQLNLDPFQRNQAETKRGQADDASRQRIAETWVWLIVPGLPQGAQIGSGVEWAEIRVQGQEGLAARAAKKLRNDGLLLTQMAGTMLRMELDRVPLWQGNHVEVKQLADLFAQYLYLPRLKGPGVLLESVAQGASLLSWATDTFAFAESWDEKAQRYRGLRGGRNVQVSLDSGGLVVRTDVAGPLLNQPAPTTPSSPPPPSARPYPTGDSREPGPTVREPVLARRFHGTIELDPTRMGRDAGRVAEEVVQHLAGLVGATVTVTLLVHADVPDGVPDHVKRVVSENCKTLKFKAGEFDE